MVEKCMIEKSGLEKFHVALGLKSSRVEKSWVENFMVEMSVVEKFMVEKSRVENSFGLWG